MSYDWEDEPYPVVLYNLSATETTETSVLERSLLTCTIDGESLVISDDDEDPVYLSEFLEHSFLIGVRPSLWEDYGEGSILEFSYNGKPIMELQYIPQ